MAESLSELSERSVTSRPSSRLGESSRQLSISPTSGSSVRMSKTSRPRKSAVWDYFEYDDKQDKSLCQVLKSPISESDLSDPSGVCGHKSRESFRLT